MAKTRWFRAGLSTRLEDGESGDVCRRIRVEEIDGAGTGIADHELAGVGSKCNAPQAGRVGDGNGCEPPPLGTREDTYLGLIGEVVEIAMAVVDVLCELSGGQRERTEG